MQEEIVPNSGFVEKEREFQSRPQHRVLSRGPNINRETVRENVGGSQFHLIHVAARMTRKILKDRRKDEIDPYVTPVDALQVMETEAIEISDYLLVPPNDEWRANYYAKKLNEGWFWYR